MPRVNLPHTQWSRAGIVADGVEVNGDATNNHHVTNDGNVVVRVRNNGVTPRNITVHFAREVDGQTVAPRIHTLGASASGWIGPWPVSEYGNLVLIDVAHADVKMTAYHL